MILFINKCNYTQNFIVNFGFSFAILGFIKLNIRDFYRVTIIVNMLTNTSLQLL